MVDKVLSTEPHALRSARLDLINAVPGFHVEAERSTFRGRTLVGFRVRGPGDRRASVLLGGVAALARLRQLGWADAAINHFEKPREQPNA